MSFHVAYMLPVFFRLADGYIGCVCCLFVATFGGTRTFGISLSAMFMFIICLFLGGGVDLPTSRGRGCLLLILSVFRSASLNGVSLFI